MLRELIGTCGIMVLCHTYGWRNLCHKEPKLLHSFSIFHKTSPRTSGKKTMLDSPKAADILTTSE